ncbi:MAG TPA: Uma2 family endonuclease [Thermoanaerobaculia bacterium]|nr:Uma2 family endonuclease [Thermoanaerobaculia bacterium]
MSQPAVAALAPLPFELVLDDGEPLETEWHTLQYPLLRRLFRQVMAEQGRTDFYTGGNMFVYYSLEQAWEVAKEVAQGLEPEEQKAFRGPDVFWVGGVDPNRERKVWIAWEEGGRLPDVIVELLSPSTKRKDRTEKRDLYARVFRTAEYFMHDPDARQLEGLRLAGRSYRPIEPDPQGRLWSEQLKVFFGVWHGVIEGRKDAWVRLYRPDGSLVPTPEEQAEAADRRAETERLRADAERQRADTERQRAEAERLRAEAAEAELARLRAFLEERGGG